MHPKDGFDMNDPAIHALIGLNFEILILLLYIRKENNIAKSMAQKRF